MAARLRAAQMHRAESPGRAIVSSVVQEVSGPRSPFRVVVAPLDGGPPL